MGYNMAGWYYPDYHYNYKVTTGAMNNEIGHHCQKKLWPKLMDWKGEDYRRMKTIATEGVADE
jgi:hypothetical protein